MEREGINAILYSHLHTVLYQPIRSLVFCSLMDYSSALWVCTKEQKQAAQHGVLAGEPRLWIKTSEFEIFCHKDAGRRGAARRWMTFITCTLYLSI